MDYMRRALDLARQALGIANPNPAVGAVVVKDGRIVGEGHTQPPGSAHGEVVALRQAGKQARGATLYVTLEPCCHYGRTSPCTDHIIAAGVTEVHFPLIDPNPHVAGKGQAALEAAGIKTVVGEGAEEAYEVAEAHIKVMTTNLPFVTAKFAMSLDGKIATRGGDSRWISGPQSRALAHELRRASDAVLVGVNTVIADDPLLTARDANGNPLPRQPLRIVMDSLGRTPLTAKLLRGPGGQVVVATTAAMSREKEQSLRKLGVEVLRLPSRQRRVALEGLLEALRKRSCTHVLIEGGGAVLGAAFDRRLVDKVVVFVAPMIIGGKQATGPVGGRGAARIQEALRLDRVRVQRIGDDVVVTGYMRKGGA